jgi:hypothetical protein
MFRQGSRAFGIVNGIVAAMFLVSAALQLNDPDPVFWTALYVAAAAACLATGRVEQSWALAALVGLAAFAWAVTLLPVLHEMVFSDLFKTMKAETPVIEESRELLGLLMVGAWMVVLTFASPRPRRPD